MLKRLNPGIILAALLLPSVAQAAGNCPLLGTSFPPPTKLSALTTGDAFTNLTSAIQDALNTGRTSHGAFDANGTSFSIQLFSADSTNLFQFHYTAPSLAQAGANATGVKQVDSNTVYRVGSLSKLFTALLVLLEGGGEDVWDEKVTKFVPELTDSASGGVAWEEITMGALANHLGGIGRDCKFLLFYKRRAVLMDIFAVATGDLSAQGLPVAQFGLPPVAPSDIPTCGTSVQTPLCNRTRKAPSSLHPLSPHYLIL
jgi:CubicO group peptidase (beta-lactamase class C family)